MTYDQAMSILPANAVWSSSFGYPGEGGFNAFYRTPCGKRYVVSNGPWDALKPFDWTVTLFCEPSSRPAMIRS